MKFYEEHAGDRDRFEIVALHEPRVKTFDDLDEKVKPVAEKHWEGKSLPFPVWLDPTGETLGRWSVNAFPSIFLVDPDGKLVRGGSLEMLEDQLKSGDPEVTRLAEALKGAKDAKGAAPHLAALGERKNRFAVEALLAYAKGAPKDAMLPLLAALGAAGGPEATAFLVGENGLGAKEEPVKLAAAKALAAGGDASSLDALVAAYAAKTTKDPLRVVLVGALVKAAPADARVLETVVTASKSSTLDVKVAAVEALAKIDAVEAFDRLAWLLQKDMSVAVRSKAAAALSSTGKPAARDLLKAASEGDKAKTVREAAAKALAAMPTE